MLGKLPLLERKIAMATQTLRVRITGEIPLLCHNGQLANPMNEWSKRMKQVSGKKKKTDADYEELARLEWNGGLYLRDGKPCIPGEMIERAIEGGAAKSNRRKGIIGSIFVREDPFIKNGGTDLSDLDALWTGHKHEYRKNVRVGMSRVMRTRPMFDPWALDDVTIEYDDKKINRGEVLKFLQDNEALGDWRPRFGRYKVEEVAAQ
jgi:hypothetical protein